MIFCGTSSTESNSGIVYECLCSPTCAWTQVANLNTIPSLVWYNAQATPGITISSDVTFTTIMSLSLPLTGTYQCTYDGSVYSATVGGTAALLYELAHVSGTPLNNAERVVYAQYPSGFQPVLPVFLSATVVVASAPYTIFIESVMTGPTGSWNFFGYHNLRCLKTA
jgi:hypothetical protein